MLSLRIVFALVILVVAFLALGRPIMAAAAAKASANDRASKFVTEHVAKLRPLELAANMAWWKANTTGKDEDFQEKERAQNRIDEALADSARFQELKDIKKQGGIDDPLVAREIDLLYLTY